MRILPRLRRPCYRRTLREDRPYEMESRTRTGATVYATSSKEHCSSVPPNELAQRWGTSLDIASKTLQVTTQRGIRNLSSPLTRRFRTVKHIFAINIYEPMYIRIPCFLRPNQQEDTPVDSYLSQHKILQKYTQCNQKQKLRTSWTYSVGLMVYLRLSLQTMQKKKLEVNGRKLHQSISSSMDNRTSFWLAE